MNSPRHLLRYGLIALLAIICAPAALAQVSISVGIAPPPLIVESQPLCPNDGYLWTPGYWAYDQNVGEYYWVPGVWVQPPQIGFLWTPCYWGWNNNVYAYHPGYWGPTVGFYGGVNYGHGYWGNGYGGGRWNNNHFYYNTAANNVSPGRVHNTYVDRTVVRNNDNRVSYNGGRGGINARPTSTELNAENHRVSATPQQQAHYQQAAQSRSHPVKVSQKNDGNQPAANSTTQFNQTKEKHASPTGVNTQAEKKTSALASAPKTQPKHEVVQPENKMPTAQATQNKQRNENAATGFQPEHKNVTPTATHAQASPAAQHSAAPKAQAKAAAPQNHSAPQKNDGGHQGGGGPQGGPQGGGNAGGPQAHDH
jgi:hypothetical protein